ncbi:MAG: type II toxin-antitoxin system RelE/ParE family toxin [Gammaproteobacteria bacterium]|nr:type II toxin-antitoxin system RelE/ParE family toxin [Gammaproteobacteria bacterium]
MSAKPVVLRDRARSDIEDVVEYYLGEAGLEVALSFIDEVEDALRTIGNQPGVGSPRYAHELGVPGLRSRSAGRFAYLIFYVVHEEEVDVWRVLHAARDIPARMRE